MYPFEKCLVFPTFSWHASLFTVTLGPILVCVFFIIENESISSSSFPSPKGTGMCWPFCVISEAAVTQMLTLVSPDNCFWLLASPFGVWWSKLCPSSWGGSMQWGMSLSLVYWQLSHCAYVKLCKLPVSTAFISRPPQVWLLCLLGGGGGQVVLIFLPNTYTNSL